jgi:hypothetical protein
MGIETQDAVNTLDAVRLYVSFVAGQNRRAQVETLAGWVDIDIWKGYGTDKSGYVQFFYDEARRAIRERPVPGKPSRTLDHSVFGVWPVRFISTRKR